LLQPTGSRTYGTFRIGTAEVVAELKAHDVSQVNERIELSIDMNRAVLIDPETGMVL
jgi:multiple sugar transport system ATP-binding protein